MTAPSMGLKTKSDGKGDKRAVRIMKKEKSGAKEARGKKSKRETAKQMKVMADNLHKIEALLTAHPITAAEMDDVLPLKKSDLCLPGEKICHFCRMENS